MCIYIYIYIHICVFFLSLSLHYIYIHIHTHTVNQTNNQTTTPAKDRTTLIILFIIIISIIINIIISYIHHITVIYICRWATKQETAKQSSKHNNIFLKAVCAWTEQMSPTANCSCMGTAIPHITISKYSNTSTIKGKSFEGAAVWLPDSPDQPGQERSWVRSVFKISCLFLRPRPWQFEIWDSTDT